MLAKAQESLERSFDGGYRLSSKDRRELEERLHLTTDELLRLAVGIAKPRALVPVSNFFVGSAGLTLAGEVFLGVNLEYAGVGFSQTVHSEQFLVSYSRACSPSALCRLAVSAAPCGHCRQFLREFDHKGSLTLLIGGDDAIKAAELLPRAFTPADLKVSDLFYSDPLEAPTLESVEEAARWAAALSYTPYSKVKAGSAVMTKDGRIFMGSAIENAAYNPTLPPLQAALINCHASGVDTTSELRKVVLCQQRGSIDYAAQTDALARSLGVLAADVYGIEF